MEGEENTGIAIMSNTLSQAMQHMLRFPNDGRLIRLVWLPIPLLLAATVVLWAADLRTVYESQRLLILLNFICSTLASALVAVLVGRSFLVSGEPGLLMMGCGVINWGLAVTIGSAVGHGINYAVTIHNTLACLAAFCHILGIVFSRKRYQAMRLPGSALAIAYVGILCVAGLLVVLATEDAMPLFFVQNQGGTPIRQFVLGSTIVMFGITGAVLLWTNRPLKSMFVQWYGAALLMVATGLLGVMVQPVVGGVLGWTGRITQSLGGIYFLMAAIASLRESGPGGLSLTGALREAQQNFRTLVDMSPDAIAVHADGKYVFVNPAAVHLFGAVGPEDVIGREVLSLVHPEDREAVAARMRQAFVEGSTALHRCFRVLRMDGHPVDVETIGARIEFQGRPSVQVLLRDITDRKQAEMVLRASEERYWSLFSGMTEGFALHEIITNDQGQPCDYRFLDINPAFERLTGLKRKDVIGRTHNEVLPNNDPKWLSLYGKVALTGDPVQFDNYSPPLQRHYEVLAYRPGPDQFAVIFMDITERKRAEDLLRASLAEKEVLLKEVHHRVKNNLQVISSLISLQADSQPDERLQDVLGDVRNRVRTMALVHEKLYQADDLARLDFAEYALSLLKYLWDAHGSAAEKVHLNMSFAPLLLAPEMAVHCGLILNELASNAIKHAFPNGDGCEVSVSLAVDPDTGAVCLRVRDNGVGLPANLEWRQASSLGLRLVQMLTSQMRGTVQTGPGPGTEFQVNFTVNANDQRLARPHV